MDIQNDNSALREVKNDAGEVIRTEGGFNPTFHPKELDKTFRPGEFVFVAPMGDINFCPPEQFDHIMNKILAYPQTRFLLQTKHPALFLTRRKAWPDNVYCGTTIESNRKYIYNKSATVVARADWLGRLKHPHKLVSIEPIMDFDVPNFLGMINSIKPEIVEVGTDNWHWEALRRFEPPWEKVEALFKGLRECVPTVVEKDGLERLKNGNSR